MIVLHAWKAVKTRNLEDCKSSDCSNEGGWIALDTRELVRTIVRFSLRKLNLMKLADVKGMIFETLHNTLCYIQIIQY